MSDADDGNEFSPEFVHRLSVAMGVMSGISMAACLAVTLLIYTREHLFKKNLCKFVMIIMLNEVGTCIGTSLGNSSNDSFDCYLQAFLTCYFPYCQSLWLSLTAWMLHRIIFYSKPTNLLSAQSFALCSGVPVILALLPLTTNDYGNEGDASGQCFLRNRDNSPRAALTLWTVFHYAIIYLNIAAYVVVLLLARKRLSRSRKSLGGRPGVGALDGIMALLRQLVWYPIITFFAILPESLYNILASMTAVGVDINNIAAFIYISHLGAISGGFFMALAFVLTNAEVNAEARLLLGLPATPVQDTLPLAADHDSSSSSSSSRVVSMGNIFTGSSLPPPPALDPQ